MKTVWKIIKMLLLGWLLGIIALIRLLMLLFKKYKGQPSSSNCGCTSIPTTVYKRPDPFIYDQYFLMSLGFGVTWDNPDIKVYPNGTTGMPYSPPSALPLSPDQLSPDTEYLVAARIWNNSKVAAALGVVVDLSYLSFGIGAGSHSIPNPPTSVNIGVIGDTPHFPAYAYMKWTTPAIPGHYCLQVKLTCNDDLNPNNNLGQLNTHVVAAQSPANFSFLLRNPDRKAHDCHFKTDTYHISDLLPCEETRRGKSSVAEMRKRNYDTALARNKALDFPIPPGWTVEFSQDVNTLAAGEEKTIQVTVTPPGTFTGKQPINIHAFTEKNELIGGVTVYITQ
jgi:hypothetical protein